MSCVLCGSDNEAEFPAEMMFHFTGLKYLDKPGVLVFSDVMVCLDCGFSRFSVPKEELAMLASRGPKNKRSAAQ